MRFERMLRRRMAARLRPPRAADLPKEHHRLFFQTLRSKAARAHGDATQGRCHLMRARWRLSHGGDAGHDVSLVLGDYGRGHRRGQ